MWNISIQALLHLGVIMIVAVLFHFMYILTIPTDMKLLKHVSDWALGKYACVNNIHLLCSSLSKNAQTTNIAFLFFHYAVGLAYLNLVYDWVKAAVMFGVINTVSRLDHLDPPKPPKCITMLYVFSEA